MCGLADVLINPFMIPDALGWGNENLIERATNLLSSAAAIEPDNERLLFCQGYLLRARARPGEACAVLQRVIDLLPNDFAAYRQFAFCQITEGHAAKHSLCFKKPFVSTRCR